MTPSDIARHIPVTLTRLPHPANLDGPFPPLTSDQKIIDWLLRLTTKSNGQKPGVLPPQKAVKPVKHSVSQDVSQPTDDWQTVSSLCGHQAEDFTAAGVNLPLTAAEIDHFRHNHRETDTVIGRDFLVAQSDLPSPLGELYGLYKHRARLDAEAALFVAQATGTTRIASTMADLLAIGAFANGFEFISHVTLTYSVPAAFDTSDIIDRTNLEVQRRLALPSDHPSHLLKLTPDEISVLAANIVDKGALSAPDFLEKANLLAEARQDVNRMTPDKQFATAIGNRDLPLQQPWVMRLSAAYARIFESWVAGLPEVQGLKGNDSSV